MTKHEFRFAANVKWLFAGLPFEQRFEAAATEGFRAVEIPNPYEQSPSQLRRMLESTGLEAVLVNSPQGPPGSPTAGGAACLPGYAYEFQTGVERGLEYATEIGCSLLHVVGGRKPDGVSRVEAFAQYVRNITWAADRASSTPVRVLLEMQNQRSAPGFVLRSQSEAAAVAKAVGGPVGLLFDVFHTQVAEGDVASKFDEVRPLVDHIQIGDGPSRSEPGTGELAWSFLLDRIRRSGYTGWFGCEFEPLGESVGVLQRLNKVI